MLSTAQSRMGDRSEVKRGLRPEGPLWSVAGGLNSKRPATVRMA